VTDDWAVETLEHAGIAVVWDEDPAAPLACYSADPPELTIGAVRWRATPRRAQRRVLCHELGHHLTGALYVRAEDPAHNPEVQRLEAKADRKALELLVPDAVIYRAAADGCQTPAEFAEACGVDVVTMAARLVVFQRRLAS
jgi:Zn-dependent peptidase ImmA (M78 family)